MSGLRGLGESTGSLPAGHELLGGACPRCSCGEWTAPLGQSVARAFDKHLLAVIGFSGS